MPNGILIADDSGSFRRAVRSYLTQNNFEVCGEAIDGNDVLEKANNLQPRLVLLDLRMPHRNGVEVASLLRARMPAVRAGAAASTQAIPAIANVEPGIPNP